MWKRLRGKETQISAPTLIDTTYDGRPFTRPSGSDLSPISPSNTIRPIGSPYGNTTIITPQPRKLYTSIGPLVDSYAQRAAEEPTSVYSQDPQDLAYQLGSSHAGYANHEISPPASPDLPANLEYQRRSVSPVEPTSPDQGMSSRSPQSHIPVMKRAPSSADAGAGREGAALESATKWDTYSGEPTTSGKGRPGSFRPGDSIEIPCDGSLKMEHPAYPQDGADSQSRMQTFSQRAARALKQDRHAEPQPRQPWRGASGRQAIVAPMPDRTVPRQHPVMPPPRSSRRPGPAPTAPSNEAPGATMVRPVRSDSYGAMTPGAHAAASTHSTANLNPASRQPHQRKHSDHTKRIPRKSVDTTASGIDPNDPISRFSWTTTATNTTYQNSPPPSPPPPIPAAYANGGSVLNRGRPVPMNKEDDDVDDPALPPLKISPVRRIRENKENEPTSSTRKPPQFAQINTKVVDVSNIGSNTPRSATGSTTPTGRSRTPSTRGGGKALPAPPQDPSRDPNDHIAIMQARLDDLSHQRINIAKAEQSIRAKQPQNPLITDLRAMRDFERKLDALREELEEVKREEHEIGLKLHRAWRKREKEEGGWEGGLWVRRVTG